MFSKLKFIFVYFWDRNPDSSEMLGNSEVNKVEEKYSQH